MIKKIFICSVIFMGILSVFFLHEKTLVDFYSLKCTHKDFSDVQKRVMLKKRLFSKLPLTIFEEPWHSKKFDKTITVQQLSPLGTLSEANTEFLIFTPKSNSEIVSIKINRNSLELTIQGDGTGSYFCEKKSPDSLYFEIEEELIKTKRKIQI